VLFAACSSATEEGIEQLIESQSGGDVEIDLDDGGFSFDSDEGSFSVDEDGNFVVEGEDGEVFTGQATDDGFTVEGEDGNADFSIDGEDGDVVFESDDGSFEFSEGGDIPDEWPSAVPTPENLAVTASSFFGDDTGGQSSVTGNVEGSPVEYVEAYGAALETAGFEETGVFTSGDDITATYESGEFTVAVNGLGSSGEQLVTISVFSNG
ncbi:MAG: hypothetical protein AAFY28_14565, partial [Actinomycetota bacterium]